MKHREGKMAKYDAKEIADDAMDVFKMIDKDIEKKDKDGKPKPKKSICSCPNDTYKR